MSLYTFKEHLLNEAKTKTVTVNWGRFNPPTIGHEKLLDISMKKGTGDHRVYASQTAGNKKNPLDWKTKIKYMRKMFPKHARHIIMDKKVKTIWDVAVTAYKDGYTEFELVVGDDRHQEFVKLLDDWNGRKGRHGFYEFDVIDVMSAGVRDPDADGAAGMSASKMRAAAEDNDLITDQQYGGRQGRMVQSAVLNKIAYYNISHQSLTSCAFMDNDARACYDRIVTSLSSAECRRWGISHNMASFEVLYTCGHLCLFMPSSMQQGIYLTAGPISLKYIANPIRSHPQPSQLRAYAL